MQSKKGKRINFKILHCSSDDSQYPVSQLLLQSPEAKGWQSKRFATYPQTLVIELVENSIINKISVLSHQSKIATKIQFEVKRNEEQEWKKLGRISLDSNVNTNYQARELKQANINDIEARLVRLILRVNHVNSHNLFNQVGLISLSFYGFRAEEFQKQTQNINRQPSLTNQPSNDIDQNTLNKLKDLELMKKKAVDNEDYEKAKSIKQEIQRIKSIASALANLEERKQEAIRRQNYDDAKTLNDKIKELRDNFNNPGSKKPQETNQNYKPQQYQRQKEQEQHINSVSPISNNTKNKITPLRPADIQKEVRNQQQGRGVEHGDQRPIIVKNTNPYGQQEEEVQKLQNRDNQLQSLTKQLYDEVSQYFSIFDEDIFRHIFSKDHSNRQKGIEMILHELKTTRNRQDFIGACLYVIKNLIDDKIASVLISTIGLLNQMMRKLKPQASSYNQPLVEYILDKMSDYLGHINQKIRSVTEQTFANLPIYPLANRDVCYRCLSTIGKRQKPPKILVGRLKMINRLIKEHQLGKDYEELIRYAVKYADDKNNDVRNSAVAVLCSISIQIGFNMVQPFLKNLRPPIIKSIEQKLEQLGGGKEEVQDLDERPIKPKQNEKNTGKNKANDFESNGNEFIDIPKKTQTSMNSIPTCDFCKRTDKRFADQDYMDMHYFNACPMLIICNQCNQGIEISTLTSHLVGQCANSKYYKKCPRCKEAVHQKTFKAHVEKKECLSAKPLAVANRCPLCHLDVNPGANGWKEHLVDEGCQNNPRA